MGAWSDALILPFKDIPRDLREWTRWILSIETQNQVTISLTGYGTTVTGDIEWVRLGRRVSLHAPEAITGTSNAVTMTLGNLPESITPETAKRSVVSVVDDGADVLALATISGTTITFATGSPLSPTGFTNSGQKGLPAGFQMHWIVDA